MNRLREGLRRLCTMIPAWAFLFAKRYVGSGPGAGIEIRFVSLRTPTEIAISPYAAKCRRNATKWRGNENENESPPLTV